MTSLFNIIIIIGTYRFVICYDISSEEVTLTSAKERITGSPKPSTLFRRINVDRAAGISSTPLDLFRVRNPERRRRGSLDTVWKWDFWCQLQPKVGNCTTASRRQAQQSGTRQSYYYDAQLDTCLAFTYSGCDGNRNNFKDLVECERHCKGATYMSLKESSRTTYCGLQPNAGLCMALIQRYYYDVNGDECKPFTYGGCGGNQNRFKTSMMCNQRCKTEANDEE